MKFYLTLVLILFLFLITTECSLLTSIKRKKTKNKNFKILNNTRVVTNNNCNKAEQLTIDIKKFIVDYHNKLRNDVASKSINWKSSIDLNDYFQYGSNMMQMYWDNQLANQAQTYANLCKPKHSSYQERADHKFKSNESIFYRRYRSGAPQKSDFGTAISFWFDKIKTFSVLKKNVSSFDYLGVNIDSFAQIIWADNFKIGCGFSLFVDPKNNYTYEFYVCLYGDSGLRENNPIYKVSSTKICECPNSTSCGNSDYTSLCCPIEFCTKNNLFSKQGSK